MSIALAGQGSSMIVCVTRREADLARAPLSALAGAGTAAENAAILKRIFSGERGPQRDIVLLNAAAALVTGRIAGDLREGVARAAEAIDSGAVLETVRKLRNFALRFG